MVDEARIRAIQNFWYAILIVLKKTSIIKYSSQISSYCTVLLSSDVAIKSHVL